MHPSDHSNPEISQNTTESQDSDRRIRSFIRRQGRLTVAQGRALDILWPVYGLNLDDNFDATNAFGRDAPLVLEIGFGNGDSLADMAAAEPESNFIGIEVHRPGVGHLLLKLDENGIGNVRVFCADAIEILTRLIPDGSLDRLQLFFPDPWPKARHHKRRLIRPEVVQLIATRLKPGGIVHCATDWAHYALQMLAVLSAEALLENTAGPVLLAEEIERAQGFALRPEHRPLTKFENRGLGLGHGVRDLVFRRRNNG